MCTQVQLEQTTTSEEKAREDLKYMQFDMNELKKERTEFKEKATNIGHEMQKVCLSHMCRLQRYTRDQEVPSSVLTHCAVEYGP